MAHAEELGLLFYPSLMKDLGMPLPAIDSKDGKMMNYLTQMWTDFAKTGYKSIFSYFIRILHTYILTINLNRFLGIQRLLQIYGYH